MTLLSTSSISYSTITINDNGGIQISNTNNSTSYRDLLSSDQSDDDEILTNSTVMIKQKSTGLATRPEVLSYFLVQDNGYKCKLCGKNNRLTKFLKSVDKDVHNQNDSVKTIGEEILLYGSLCRKNPTIDGITFWKAHGEQLPLLKGMAAVYLSTPATSVPSESAFSLSAYVGRKERARLSPENLSYSVFLKDKLLSSFE
ncbi:unnamed protein product [Rotaria magnacalcarata]